MDAEERIDRVGTTMRALADDWPRAESVEDIVAARLFSEVWPPVTIGRFTVLEVVGSGGMGTVYAAHDPELDRNVAIKVVSPARESSEPLATAQARLLREAWVLARLTHPNVVTIHECGLHDDRLFLVMELVDGASLEEWEEERTHDWTEMVEVYLSAGDGLAVAHAIGIVHRDFKPANVLVGAEGRPRVVDFGLARPIARQPPTGSEAAATSTAVEYSITAAGLVCGTPGYLAPELLAGANASPQSDIYAFCVAVLEALSPARVSQERSLSPRGPEIPRGLIDTLVRGISPDPSERWATMEPLLAALRSSLAHASVRKAYPHPRTRIWGELGGLSVAVAAVVALDRLGVMAIFTAARVLLLDLMALALLGLVLARRSAWRGAFARVLLACLVGQLLNDASGHVLGRSLAHTMVATAIGAATLHTLGAMLAERWLAWCALAYLLSAGFMLLMPEQLGIGYMLGPMSSLLVAAVHLDRHTGG